MRTIGKLLLMVVAVLASLFFAMRYVQSIHYADSDFISFYIAGWLVRSGQNPYSPQQWHAARELFFSTWLPDPTFLYPLPLAVFFIPLSFLPLDKAYAVWIVISLACVVATIVILSFYASNRLGWPVILPLIAAALIFRPILVTFTNGQLGAAFLLISGLSIVLWQRGHWFAGGMLIALLALKPSWGILLLLLIGVWFLFSRRWHALAGIVVSGVCLTCLGLLVNLDWPQQFIAISTNKFSSTFGLSPNIWSATSLWCGEQRACLFYSGLSLAVLLLGSVGILYYWRGKLLSPIDAVGIACAVSVIATPYLWAYDQIMIWITVVAAVLHGYRRHLPYLVVTLYPILLAILSIGLIFIAMQSGRDTWSVLIPLIALLILFLWGRDQLLSL